MTALDELGSRICILGPSNSGKSTLANAISRKTGLPAVHLDQLFHIPNTDWKPRPAEEFDQLHNEAIAQPRWVMDGNYTRTLPQRLNRATGLILMDAPTIVSLWRYLRRTWFEKNRHGALEVGRDSVKWQMLRHIVVVTPANRRRYSKIFDGAELPKCRLTTAEERHRFYKIERPGNC